MSVKIFGDGTITGVEFPMPVVKEKRVARFTGDGTWTVPAGVTYAIAHMLGGGGGIGAGASGGDGGASSVAFASGTVTSNGAPRGVFTGAQTVSGGTNFAGQANTGSPAVARETGGTGSTTSTANWVVAGAAVTPAASITVTVGAGGSAGTGGAAGGSGYVYIEYEINPEDEI